jgi:hypothetical protein
VPLGRLNGAVWNTTSKRQPSTLPFLAVAQHAATLHAIPNLRYVTVRCRLASRACDGIISGPFDDDLQWYRPLTLACGAAAGAGNAAPLLVPIGILPGLPCSLFHGIAVWALAAALAGVMQRVGAWCHGLPA